MKRVMIETACMPEVRLTTLWPSCRKGKRKQPVTPPDPGEDTYRLDNAILVADGAPLLASDGTPIVYA